MHTIERLILRFSRSPGAGDYSEPKNETPLELLQKEYPDLRELVDHKYILDFGCGRGHQSVALAQKYGARVVGLDINLNTLDKANQHGGHIVRFTDKLEPDERFDVVISQNAMEHFPDPVAVLNDMIRATKPNGKILMTFGPPWYAPYGSHMHFFCKIPWINILFPERSVMKVRSLYRSDGAKRYEEVESGLNKMSLRRFERIIRNSGLTVERISYRAVKRLTFLTKIPVLRELMCNHVTAVLKNT